MAKLLAKLFGGDDQPRPDTHNNQGIDYHQAWVMTQTGQRTSTWVSCTCGQASPGGEHDGPTAT